MVLLQHPALDREVLEIPVFAAELVHGARKSEPVEFGVAFPALRRFHRRERSAFRAAVDAEFFKRVGCRIERGDPLR